MARPRIDEAEYRDRLIAAAEDMLRETGGQRLVLSELAARTGMSQSYAYRFFATKADLVRALAARWFAEVEALSAAQTDLQSWLLAMLRLKRDRYLADPAVFDAYLRLAADHTDLVRTHSARLHDDVAALLGQHVPPPQVPAALALFLDATTLFRDPACISAAKGAISDDRGSAVVQMLLTHWEHTDRGAKNL